MSTTDELFDSIDEQIETEKKAKEPFDWQGVLEVGTTVAAIVGAVFLQGIDAANKEEQRKKKWVEELETHPTKQRVLLATKVSSLSEEQVRSISGLISKDPRKYGLPVWSGVGRSVSPAAHKELVVNAISSCSSKGLTSLAIYIAGA